MSQRFVDYKTTFSQPWRLGRTWRPHLLSVKHSPLQIISSNPINPRLGEEQGVPTIQMWKWRLREKKALAPTRGFWDQPNSREPESCHPLLVATLGWAMSRRCLVQEDQKDLKNERFTVSGQLGSLRKPSLCSATITIINVAVCPSPCYQSINILSKCHLWPKTEEIHLPGRPKEARVASFPFLISANWGGSGCFADGLWAPPCWTGRHLRGQKNVAEHSGNLGISQSTKA